MHSLDTVKTRQQGDPHMPPKYTSLGNTYYTIWRQEGFARGLYGGVLPAFLGSFGGTCIFFGTYEYMKRLQVDYGVTPWIAYFNAGLLADLAAAPLYVPSEVLKTRLQLQGRYNNPHFSSGYNYRSTAHATRQIVRQEGFRALFHGFGATLWRDLPYSALQFAFYEQERKLAMTFMGSKDIGLPMEILTGATAGGMAGVITCPLDVVKTRLQTQKTPELMQAQSMKSAFPPLSPNAPYASSAPAPIASDYKGSSRHSSHPPPHQPKPPPNRGISTSGASTSLKQHSVATLNTSSMFEGLRIIYRTEGMAGWFRGVGPRGVWTSIQSGTMLVLYQQLLKWFDAHPLVKQDEV